MAEKVQWEYKHIWREPGDDLADELTRESASGWEPVFYGFGNVDCSKPALHVIMRRPRGKHND